MTVLKFPRQKRCDQNATLTITVFEDGRMEGVVRNADTEQQREALVKAIDAARREITRRHLPSLDDEDN